MKRAIISVFLVLSALARAECPYPKFTPPAGVKLDGGSVLLLTHASREFDPKQVSKRGMDEIVREAKKRDVPVVYLHEPKPDKNHLYFYGDCDPTYFFGSYGGELSFKVRPRHVLTSGGFFENCKERTVQHVLREWAKTYPNDDLRFSEIMSASYQLQGFMSTSDKYYPGYRKYVESTGSWAITWLDLMRIIDRRPDQIEYAHRYLRRNVTYFPKRHRVVLAWDGEPISVFRETGPGNPTLTFDLITLPEAAFESGSDPFSDPFEINHLPHVSAKKPQ